MLLHCEEEEMLGPCAGIVVNGTDFLTSMQIASFLKKHTKLHFDEAYLKVCTLDDYNTLVIFRNRNFA